MRNLKRQPRKDAGKALEHAAPTAALQVVGSGGKQSNDHRKIARARMTNALLNWLRNDAALKTMKAEALPHQRN